MNQILPQKTLRAIVITGVTAFWFVACGIDESGTNPNASGSSTTSSASSSTGMGGDLLTTSSTSGGGVGGAGVGGAGGGSSSSSSGSTGMQGAPCTLPSDCSSGFCEDSVCCDKTCGPCLTCNSSNSKGTCIPMPIGTDDCPMDGKLCSDKAQCECGVSLPLGAEGMCPADPKWSSPKPGVCMYTCDQMDECKNKPDVTCAAGSDCIIDCTGNGSCEGTTFNCPAGYKCTMNCQTTDSCKNSVLNCSSDGPCRVECGQVGGNSCNMTVNCGSNSCSSNCDGTAKPVIKPKDGTVCPAKLCP